MKGIFYENVHKMIFRDDLPKPIIKSNEVLIKVKYCGICGSCVESFKHSGMYSPGIIIGHEFSGDLVEIGADIKKLKVGTRVTINPQIPCNDCYWCNSGNENMCKDLSLAYGTFTDGGMAEFVNVRADRIHVLPDSVSYKEGATIEPFCVGIYAVQQSGLKMGDSAVVYGAGTIGLMIIQALKIAGAGKIFVLEALESKHKRALELGADYAFLPKDWKKIQRYNERRGPDHVFDSVGIGPTVMSSINLIRRGGHITLIGMNPTPFEISNFYGYAAGNITLRGVYGYVQNTFKTAIILLEKKLVNLKPMITKVIKLEEVEKMFEILAQPHDEIKVLVEID